MHPIARYRTGLGWSQVDLAERIGVHPNTVLAWEKGARPRPKQLAKLAEVLGIGGVALLDEIIQWSEHTKAAA